MHYLLHRVSLDSSTVSYEHTSAITVIIFVTLETLWIKRGFIDWRLQLLAMALEKPR